MGDDEPTTMQYDAVADEYAADNEQSAYNAYYERPETISLLGVVRGRRVLDVGCGAGPLTAWLVDHGATVTALDVSARMLQLARRRLGDAVTFLVADLAEPLSFAEDDSFDLVVASLVLHYLEDWEPPLREFRRVLRSDGAVVLSTHHPSRDWIAHSFDDYFAIKRVNETWVKRSKEFEVHFWRRPLRSITEAIASAGFLIERLTEPEPSPELRELDPGAFEVLTTTPQFFFFRLRPC